MKKSSWLVDVCVGSCCILFAVATPALGQGTSFSYQGQLISGGAVANGNYDLASFTQTLGNLTVTGGTVYGTTGNALTVNTPGVVTLSGGNVIANISGSGGVTTTFPFTCITWESWIGAGGCADSAAGLRHAPKMSNKPRRFTGTIMTTSQR